MPCSGTFLAGLFCPLPLASLLVLLGSVQLERTHDAGVTALSAWASISNSRPAHGCPQTSHTLAGLSGILKETLNLQLRASPAAPPDPPTLGWLPGIIKETPAFAAPHPASSTAF